VFILKKLRYSSAEGRKAMDVSHGDLMVRHQIYHLYILSNRDNNYVCVRTKGCIPNKPEKEA
jgi:hypothetical protein